MNKERLAGYLLLGFGALAIVSRMGRGSGWLWIAIVAAAFFWAYSSQRRYGFLVTGCVLAGIALGIMLSGWGIPGALLFGLAAGFYGLEQVSPSDSRWPIFPAAILAGLGALAALIGSGILGSFWFALLLIAAGSYLLFRGEEPAKQVQGDWVHVDNPPVDKVAKKAAQKAEEAAKSVAEGVKKSVGEGELGPKLRAWREQVAAREERPEARILRDETLDEIAQKKPQTREALAEINGVGEVTLERYGDEILALVRL